MIILDPGNGPGIPIHDRLEVFKSLTPSGQRTEYFLPDDFAGMFQQKRAEPAQGGIQILAGQTARCEMILPKRRDFDYGPIETGPMLAMEQGCSHSVAPIQVRFIVMEVRTKSLGHPRSNTKQGKGPLQGVGTFERRNCSWGLNGIALIGNTRRRCARFHGECHGGSRIPGRRQSGNPPDDDTRRSL